MTLVMIGGSRNAEDAARVEALKAMAREMDIHVSPNVGKLGHNQ